MLNEVITGIVKAAVLEALSENEVNKVKDVQSDEVMTTKQLAVYLQCSVPWLVKNLKKLDIPKKTLNREYRFLRTEIDNWLKGQDDQKNSKVNSNINYKKNEGLKIV